MNSQHTVVLFLEALQGKEEALKNLALEVVKKSRLEEACLEYRMHNDINNPAIFIFYENWKSKEEHAKQFEKDYIIDFVKQLERLLATPFKAFYASEVK